jgi:hypothetical protein
VAKGESVPGILRVVGDALALLRTVCGLVRTKGGGPRTPSTTQDLLSAASELLVLLLARVPADLSRVQTAQAIALYNEMSETVAVYQSLVLTYHHGHGQHQGWWADDHSGLVGVLETFMVSLSLVVGEDVRVAQAASAAAVGHGVGGLDIGFGINMGMGLDAFAAPAGTGPVNVVVSVPQQTSSDMDAITLGLVLNHIVCIFFFFFFFFFLVWKFLENWIHPGRRRHRQNSSTPHSIYPPVPSSPQIYSHLPVFAKSSAVAVGYCPLNDGRI